MPKTPAPPFSRRFPRFVSPASRAPAAGLLAAAAVIASPPASGAGKTVLEIRGEDFYINGRPTYSEIENSPARGLLMNARFIQGVFDVKNGRSRFDRFGRVFDPERNTDDLIRALPEWRASGLRAFTVGLQGGGPCFTVANGSFDANPFSPDGSMIDNAAWGRLERLLEAADGLGMAVVVSVLYEGQIRRLDDDNAVIRAVRLVAERLRDGGHRNVILEPCNEHDLKTPFDIVSTDEGMARLLGIAREAGGGAIPVGCSPCGGHFLPETASSSDVVLLHGNGQTRNKLRQLIERARRHCPGKPIMVNEDSQDVTHVDVCVREHVSWGYYNNLTKQEPPCDWGITRGEDEYFARRMAQAVGLAPAAEGNEYRLMGLEPEMCATYTSSTPMKSLMRANGFPPGPEGAEMRFVRLASLYPERIDYVEFFLNGGLVERVYDTPHTVRAMRNWSQAPLFGLTGRDTVHALVHNCDGSVVRVDPPADGEAATPAPSESAPAIATAESPGAASSAPIAARARWRGIKVNIPLDARTPSYSDAGDSAWLNVETAWDEDFWRGFIDDLADDRYNLISLWSLSPFPSLVRTPGWEHVALDDIYAAAEPVAGNSLSGRGMVRNDNRLQLVRRMTIDEKIAFWRRVMDYADGRGIAIMLYTWNIFTYGADDPRLDDRLDNADTRDYVRRSVEALFATYPKLLGIGVTAGENMDGDAESKERWLRDTYGAAVEAVRAGGRDVLFVHRTQTTAIDALRRVWADFPMVLGYKYSYAHAYSAPRSSAATAFLSGLRPDERVMLTLRNDDRHLLTAWFDPGYVRGYLDAALGDPHVEGFVAGSDNFVHLREFALRDKPPASYAERHYLPLALWGRLACGSGEDAGDMPGDIAEKTARRENCGPDEAETLLRAARLVSGVIPAMNCVFWRGADYLRYPEANCGLGERDGKPAVVWHGFRDWAAASSLPGGQYRSPREEAELRGKTPQDNRIPPSAAARALERDCRAALDAISGMEGDGILREDIAAMARLGLFASAMIDAATALANAGLPDAAPIDNDAIQAAAQRSLDAWREYAEGMERRFTPQRMPRFRGLAVDFSDLTRQAEAEFASLATSVSVN